MFVQIAEQWLIAWPRGTIKRINNGHRKQVRTDRKSCPCIMRRNIDQGSSLKQALEIANIPAWAVKLVETANTGTLDNMFGEIALL